MLFRVAVASGLLLVCVGIAWWSSFRSPTGVEVPAPGALLTNVTVIEPARRRLAGRTIEVIGDRIAAVRPARSDEASFGGFVLPGLIDMHVHHATAIGGLGSYFSLLFLAHGVTAVRNTGDFDASARDLTMRDAVRADLYPGPRVFRCGPILDGASPLWPASVIVTTPEAARREVARLSAEGVDCIKVYARMEAAVLAALREAARAEGLPVVGHVPRGVAFEEALLDDAQHLIGVPRAHADRPLDLTGDEPATEVNPFIVGWAELDEARIAEVALVSLRHGIRHTPTLVFLKLASEADQTEELRGRLDAALLPRVFRDVFWRPPERFRSGGRVTPDTWPAFRRAFAQSLATVGALHRAGVTLHAGTDTGNPFVVPGASLHEELRLLVAAGLTAEDAWAAATTDAGEFLPEADLGRLRPGAPADLLVFREDPTRDLAALDTLETVVSRGRLYDKAALDRAVLRLRTHYHGWAWETLVPLAAAASD